MLERHSAGRTRALRFSRGFGLFGGAIAFAGIALAALGMLWLLDGMTATGTSIPLLSLGSLLLLGARTVTRDWDGPREGLVPVRREQLRLARRR